MSFKGKIMNTIVAHSKLVTFGIGLAITFEIGTAIRILDSNIEETFTRTRNNK